jgi:hypothetical protein
MERESSKIVPLGASRSNPSGRKERATSSFLVRMKITSKDFLWADLRELSAARGQKS